MKLLVFAASILFLTVPAHAATMKTSFTMAVSSNTGIDHYDQDWEQDVRLPEDMVKNGWVCKKTAAALIVENNHPVIRSGFDCRHQFLKTAAMVACQVNQKDTETQELMLEYGANGKTMDVYLVATCKTE